MDLACAAEAAVPNIPGTLVMEYRWKMRTMLEKSKPSPQPVQAPRHEGVLLYEDYIMNFKYTISSFC
jgi:hypothetical protein